MVKTVIVRYGVATNMIKKKDGIKEEHQAKEMYEAIKGLKKRQTNLECWYFKKVYDRGMENGQRWT